MFVKLHRLFDTGLRPSAHILCQLPLIFIALIRDTLQTEYLFCLSYLHICNHFTNEVNRYHSYYYYSYVHAILRINI